MQCIGFFSTFHSLGAYVFVGCMNRPSFYENACFVKLALGLSKVVLLGNYDSGLGDSNQISLFRGFGINSNPILMIL